MDGVIVIRKEKGYTSHDVVAKLRGILHMKKIGHTMVKLMLYSHATVLYGVSLTMKK